MGGATMMVAVAQSTTQTATAADRTPEIGSQTAASTTTATAATAAHETAAERQARAADADAQAAKNLKVGWCVWIGCCQWRRTLRKLKDRRL